MSFNIFIVLIIIGGWFFGKFFNKLHFPAILGMLFWGIFLGNVFKNNVPKLLWEIEPTLKLSKIWILAEIFLFVLIGISVDLKVLSGAGFIGLLAIIIFYLELYYSCVTPILIIKKQKVLDKPEKQV